MPIANVNVELRPHPAQARDPDRQPLFYDDGKPVPLLPNERSIWLNGTMVGYCLAKPGTPICIIVPPRRMPKQLRDAVVAEVDKLRGGPATKVSQAADLVDLGDYDAS